MQPVFNPAAWVLFFVGRRTLIGALVVAVTASPAVAQMTASGPVLLTGQASSSGFPPGTSIFDTVNLAGGVNPTGSVTFSLFGPADVSCGAAPIFTSVKPISGNGFYSSDGVVVLQAATYRWIASYGGDANNGAAATACGDAAQTTSMGKKTTSVNATASALSPTGRTTDTVTLAGGSGLAGPTGTVTFTVHGPDNMVCSGPPVFTSTRAVAGNGTYVSDPFKPNRPGSYAWIARYSGDADNFSSTTTCSDPQQGVVVAAPVRRDPDGDYAGDGTSDPAVYRPSAAAWYLRSSAAGTMATWGEAADLTVPGDYDGNGITDVAVYRPSSGAWYVKTPAKSTMTTWGAPGDIPVPGDYDGDGTTDLAVFRPSTATWYVRGSNGSTVSSCTSWGAPGDIPVPGDYDGNGTTDFAVFRPSTGAWYIRAGAQSSVFWGTTGDIPVPADYDGNRVTDPAVYRPSTGTWYVLGGSPLTVSWGLLGDVPTTLPSAIRGFFP